MDPNKKTRGDPFQHNWLRLGEIINLAHRATIHSNRHWPPPELWRTRFDDLATAVKIGELQVPPHRLRLPRRPTIISRQRFLDMYTVIFLEDLWAFAVEQGAFWNWLRDFCRQWASAQGRILVGVEPPTHKEASETEIAETSAVPPKTRRAGRKKGFGSYDSEDAPLLEEIHALVENEKPMGLWNAALSVADQAPGKTTISRAKRLVKKYNEKYSVR